jgi:presenilin-like A22 family membrane protease
MDYPRWLPLAGMPVLLIAVQVLALLLSPTFVASGAVAFEDPSSVVNPFIFIGLLLVFTAFLLILIRLGTRRLITWIIGFSIFLTFFYIFASASLFFFGESDLGAVLAIAATILATVVLYKFPEWYVVDTLGVLIAAGAASIFGISLQVFPVLILLVLLAVYDAISVYKTKHMITLAENVVETRAPILFVIPKKRSFSYAKEGISFSGEERGAFLMGMGDLIMPTILVVSSHVFIEAPGIAGLSIPTIGAIAGSFLGLGILILVVSKGKPQAGLPPLNGGTILGFLIGCAISGTWGWVPFL